jgi:hypothetical protein
MSFPSYAVTREIVLCARCGDVVKPRPVGPADDIGNFAFSDRRSGTSRYGASLVESGGDSVPNFARGSLMFQRRTPLVGLILSIMPMIDTLYGPISVQTISKHDGNSL